MNFTSTNNKACPSYYCNELLSLSTFFVSLYYNITPFCTSELSSRLDYHRTAMIHKSDAFMNLSDS